MSATPYEVSLYAEFPFAEFPYAVSPSMSNTPSQQQQQHLMITSKAQKERERQKTISVLQENLKNYFKTLELPDVIPESLRWQLHNKFRECKSPSHFVEAVEKEMKTHIRDLPTGFKLDNDSREKIKRIPSQVCRDYIIDQRKLVDATKARPTGWQTIAAVLKDALGFGYA